jgi:hypothetical protein
VGVAIGTERRPHSGRCDPVLLRSGASVRDRARDANYEPMDAPEFRLAHCRAGLRAAMALPQAAAIRADIDAEALHALEHGFRLSWLPLRHHMQLVESIRAHLGDDGIYALWRRVSCESYDWPVMKIPLDGVRRMFGLSPAMIASQLQRFWPYYTRGIGTFRWAATEPDAGVLTLDGIPPEYLRSGTLIIGLAGGFASSFDICDVHGRVTPRAVDMTRGVVDFELRWDAAAVARVRNG